MARFPRIARVARATEAATIALGYIRLSKSEMKKEGLSAAAQDRFIREYIGGHGWVFGNGGRCYEDLQTGTRVNRHDYQAMLAEARRLRAMGAPVAIVVIKMDRFGRKTIERLRAWEELQQLKVELHAIREGGLQDDELKESLNAMIAQHEVRTLGQRVKIVNDFITRTGWARPGRPAWGYVFRPATPTERFEQSPNAVLDVAPAEAVAVVEAWRMRAAGKGFRVIGRYVAGLTDAARGGRVLAQQTIRNLFVQPLYIGRRVPTAEELDARPEIDADDPLTWPRGRWPALVSDDLWTEVQAVQRQQERTGQRASGKYPLSSILVCPRCGEKLGGTGQVRVYTKVDGTPSEYREWRYVCTSFRGGADKDQHCTTSFSGKILDEQVERIVQELLATIRDYRMSDASRRRWAERARARGERNPDLARVARLRRERARLTENLVKATAKLVEGVLSQFAYQAHQASTEAEIARIDAALAELSSVTSPPPASLRLPLESLIASVGGWADALDRATPEHKRAMYAFLFEALVPVRTGYGTYEVRPSWTAAGRALLEYACELRAGLVSTEGGLPGRP